jgi:hypothetical protein
MTRFLRLSTSAAALLVMSAAIVTPTVASAQEASESRQIQVGQKKKLQKVFRVEDQRAEQTNDQAGPVTPKQFRVEEETVAETKPPKTQEFRVDEEEQIAETPQVKDEAAAAEPQQVADELPSKPAKKIKPSFKVETDDTDAVDVTEEATGNTVTDEEKAEAIAADSTDTKAADIVAETEDEPVIIKKIKRKKKIVYVYEDEAPAYHSSGYAGSSCGQSVSY